MDEMSTVEGIYGDEKNLYKWLTIVASVMIVIGIALISIHSLLELETIIRIIGAVLLVIGVFAIVPGVAGYIEERRKEGQEKRSTPLGGISLLTGISALLLLYSIPIVSVIFAIAAIIMGNSAREAGDNQYGSGGIVAGIIALVLVVFLLFAFA